MNIPILELEELEYWKIWKLSINKKKVLLLRGHEAKA